MLFTMAVITFVDVQPIKSQINIDEDMSFLWLNICLAIDLMGLSKEPQE